MKKYIHQIVGLLLLAMMLFSCSYDDPAKTYELTYVVFYPNGNNDTQRVSAHHEFFWSSNKGTNYIKDYSITGPDIYSGSSPYKILSYTLTIDPMIK